ncbi:hypothetical protein NDU88_004173 [Pleurodeles waltl]|uniref:Uncharacterized protein n=1 Tax=Pleurodeles waltl TaxID=8319 RepID=A0AAV7SI07_PLEWA|nr:hypothetical protein NDU88_004173 [Pleurodeles waltl]
MAPVTSHAAGSVSEFYVPPGMNVCDSGVLPRWSLGLEVHAPPSGRAGERPALREVWLSFMCLRERMSMLAASCRNGVWAWKCIAPLQSELVSIHRCGKCG